MRKESDTKGKNVSTGVVLNGKEYFAMSEIIFYSITVSKSYTQTSFYSLKINTVDA